MIENPFQNFIAVSRYARWLDDKNRRETWDETVDRYFTFMKSHLAGLGYYPDDEIVSEIRDAVYNMDIMPSMRAVMTAGPALERDHVAGYNCSFLPVDSPRSFDEAMYILMCGTGVGYSVESVYINKLPVVSERLEKSNTTIVVEDSKSGWAKALRELISLLYAGQIPSWDVSKVRPAGARLKTFGGRASGPEPLESLFKFCIYTFMNAQGRRLRPIEAHDIMCKIGEVVVVGGVRRSAMISLSDLGDGEMAKAKSGSWWSTEGHRALANNSVAYLDRPSMGEFIEEWKNLYDSKSGERGIYNIKAAQKQAAKYGKRSSTIRYGTNPCSEIILRPYQFCNLSEVVVREHDTVETLSRKAHLSAILGTWQSTLTDFKYLRKIWKQNTEEERLLGVSITGQFGNAFFSGQEGLEELELALTTIRQIAVDSNIAEAERIGINPAAAVTCVKPSGTVSQLTGVSSGMHPWHAQYYIRTVRGDKKDPLTLFLEDSGVPAEDDVMKPTDTTVFSFPVKAPSHAILRDSLSAIEHLNIWLVYQRAWCDHKPSITISVKDHEWMEVGAWVWEHFDEVSGISFLPYSEHTYRQAPYQEISQEEYEAAVASFPEKIQWDMLSLYEKVDTTTGTQDLACAAGYCEVVDITS